MKQKVLPIRLIEIGWVLFFGAYLTYVASLVYPVWDDGWLNLFLLDAHEVGPYTRDRPIVYWIIQQMINFDLVFVGGLLVHFFSWTSMGAVALLLWKKVFPERAEYAVLAAGICMAPMLCTIQLHLLNNTMTGQVGPLLVYFSFFILLAALNRKRKAVQSVFLVVGMLLLICSCLLSDYAVPAGLACTVLLLFLSDGSLRSRCVLTGGFLLTLVFGYVGYSVLMSGAGREEVRPDLLLGSQGLLYSLGLTLFRLISGLWQGTMGFLLSDIGHLEYHQGPEQALLLLPGLALGLLLFFFVRSRKKAVPAKKGDSVWGGPVLLAALLLGLLPIVFMRNISPPPIVFGCPCFLSHPVFPWVSFYRL